MHPRSISNTFIQKGCTEPFKNNLKCKKKHLEMFLEQQIITLEWFLKDQVILKTGVIANTQINNILKYIKLEN